MPLAREELSRRHQRPEEPGVRNLGEGRRRSDEQPCRARSRLCRRTRSQILQVNTHLNALVEIYAMYSVAQLCYPNFVSKVNDVLLSVAKFQKKYMQNQCQ